MSTTPIPGCGPAGDDPRGRAQPDHDVISLASWARTIRDHYGLTRRQADRQTDVSGDYIKDIESGIRPREAILATLIAGYRLDPAQERMTWELWQPPRILPPLPQLREHAATPDRLEKLALHDRCGIATAYLDPLWNVLCANEAFTSLVDDTSIDNLALWAFLPAPARSPAPHLLTDWGGEADLLVAMLRGVFARYRNDPRAHALFEQLSRNREFRDRWNTGIHIAYGRSGTEQLRLRHPVSRQHYTLSIELTQLTDHREIRCLSIWPRPPA